ncbi:hypothetical protein [Actinoplanes sp. NPDC049265]|uniref:hypothetical protein n=1 Tax=Actinoplanes sp. NPDC049265 TaxID=3363902 RepID=UPI00371705C9
MRFEDETLVSNVGLVAAPDRRDRRTGSAARVQRGFDDRRPSWLDNPAFVPADVSRRGLAGSHGTVLDVNRPELGANFDSPDFGVRRDHSDWDDEIDEPFDHRPALDRNTRRRGRRITGKWRLFFHA